MSAESREFSDGYYDSTTSTDTSDLTKILIGALAGAALGSLIGGSFTQKGIEIRNRVGEGSKKIADNLKDKVADVKEGIADKYEAAKESAAGLIEKGKQKVGISSGGSSYSGASTYADGADTDVTGSGSKILLGALIVSVASTIVWSFATEKGNETRRRIAKSSKDLATNLKDKASDVAGGIVNGIHDTYEAAKEGAVDLLEQQKQGTNMSAGNTSYKSSTGADNW